MNEFFFYPNTKNIFPIYKITPTIEVLIKENPEWVKEVYYVCYKILSSSQLLFDENNNIVGLSDKGTTVRLNINNLSQLEWNDEKQLFSYTTGKYITSAALLHYFNTNRELIDISNHKVGIAILSCALTIGFVTSHEEQIKPYDFKPLFFDFKPLNFASLEVNVQKDFMKLCKSNNPILITGSTGIGKTVVFPMLAWRYDLFYSGFKPISDLTDMITFSKTGVVLSVPRKIMATSAVKTYMKNTGFKAIQGTPFNVVFQDVPFNLKNYAKTSSTMFHICVDVLTGIFQNVKTYMFDEVHEHSKFTDIWTSIVLHKKNKPRLILISATIDTELESLKKSIPNLQRIHVQGPTRFKIDEYKFLPKDLFNLIFHESSAGRVIIVFSSSENKCLKLKEDFERYLDKNVIYDIETMIYTRAIAIKDPHCVERFKNPHGCLVVFATNILESSITIDKAHAVFDFGEQYSSYFRSGITTKINFSSYMQRRGRVGRVSDGVYYRTFELEELESGSTNIDRSFLIDYIVHMTYANLTVDKLITQPKDKTRFQKTIDYYMRRGVSLYDSASKIIPLMREKKCLMDEYIIIYFLGTYEECNVLDAINSSDSDSMRIEIIKYNQDIIRKIVKKLDVRVNILSTRGDLYGVQEVDNFENTPSFKVNNYYPLFDDRQYLITPNIMV